MRARETVKSPDGEMAEVTFESQQSYPSFTLDEKSPAVEYARRAVESLGMTPELILSNGGLDANWLVRHGVQTVTFGSGQAEVHTVNEYVNVEEYLKACRLAVVLATQE